MDNRTRNCWSEISAGLLPHGSAAPAQSLSAEQSFVPLEAPADRAVVPRAEDASAGAPSWRPAAGTQ